MEESLYDMTVDILVERQGLVRAELIKRFKKTKPFRMEPVPKKDLMAHYNELPREERIKILEDLRRTYA